MIPLGKKYWAFDMILKKTAYYLALISILVTIASERIAGQQWKMRRYEVGGGLGVTQIFGDIGGTISEENWFGLKDIKIDETRLAIPLYGRYRLNPFYTLKINTALAFGHGDDAESDNDRGRSYKTMLMEFSAQGEYYFIAEERRYKSAAMFNRRGMLNNYMSFSSYLFLGVGGTYSRSQVTYTTRDPGPYDRVKPNNFTMVVPFGIGLKYTISDRWLAGAELGYRLSISDYIEGFSQTQDSKHNDVYYFLGVSVGYKLITTRRGIPRIFDRQSRNAKSAIKTKEVKRPKSKKEAME